MTFLISVVVIVTALLFVLLPRQQPLFVQRENWVAAGLLIVLFAGSVVSSWQSPNCEFPDVTGWLELAISSQVIVTSCCVLASKRPVDSAFSAICSAIGISFLFAISGSLGFALVTAVYFAFMIGLLVFLQIPFLEIEPAGRLCAGPVIAAIACAGLIVVSATIVHSDPGWNASARKNGTQSGGRSEQQENRQQILPNDRLAHLAIPLIGLGLFGIITRDVSTFRLLSLQIISLGVLSLIIAQGMANGWPIAFPVSCFVLGISTIYSLTLSKTLNATTIPHDKFSVTGIPNETIRNSLGTERHISLTHEAGTVS